MELLVLLGLVAVGVTLSSLVDFGSDEEETITRTDGTEGDDTLTGSAGRDLIIGAAGADLLDGAAGDDQLEGGFGDDVLRGGAGNDVLLSARGEDTLEGGAGHDLLYGGVGDDLLSGDAGDDILDGGQGEDTLRGGAGNDLLIGFHDSARDDVIDTPDVVDVDRLEGGAGSDLIFVGSGDVAHGGTEADLFLTGVYVDGSEAPIIEDFTPGEDVLGVQVPEGTTVAFSIVNFDGTAVVIANGTTVARLAGVGDSLRPSDIVEVENRSIRSMIG